jgi:hypothetical protein
MTTTTAEQSRTDRGWEIRAELNELAPLPDGDLNARRLARWFAMEAQVAWARLTSVHAPITKADIALSAGYAAAAHALLHLAALDATAAAVCAAQVRDAIEDGSGTGELTWQHLSLTGTDPGDAARIVSLAAELAELPAAASEPVGDPERIRYDIALAALRRLARDAQADPEPHAQIIARRALEDIGAVTGESS